MELCASCPVQFFLSRGTLTLRTLTFIYYINLFGKKNTVKVESTELTASRHCDGIVSTAKFPEHDLVKYYVRNEGQGI